MHNCGGHGRMMCSLGGQSGKIIAVISGNKTGCAAACCSLKENEAKTIFGNKTKHSHPSKNEIRRLQHDRWQNGIR
eukprot:6603255-Prymnesium_polylepis.2